MSSIEEDESSIPISVSTTEVFQAIPAKPASSKSNNGKAKTVTEVQDTQKSQRISSMPAVNYSQAISTRNDYKSTSDAENKSVNTTSTRNSKVTPEPVKKGAGRGKLIEKSKQQEKEEKR